MEKILHRANTKSQIALAKEHAVERLEIDVFAKRDRLILSHDPTWGPLVFGKNGVTKSRMPLLPVRWGAPYLTLSDMLKQDLPLLIDLKGRWSRHQLDELGLQLIINRRPADIVASLNMDLIDQFAKISPTQGIFYTLKRRGDLTKLHKKIVPNNLCGVAINAHEYPRRSDIRAIIGQFTHQDILVFFWNTIDQRQIALLKELGADGVMVDDPTQSF